MPRVLLHFDPQGSAPNYVPKTDRLLVFNTSTLLFETIEYDDVGADNSYYLIDDLTAEITTAPTATETPIPDDAGTTFHSYCNTTTKEELKVASSAVLDEWKSGTTYDIVDNPVYVVHRGVLYRLIKNGTSTNEKPTVKLVSSSTDIWYPVTRVLPSQIGDNWDSTNTYNQGSDDIVYYSNSGWRLLVASDAGTEPGTNGAIWEQLNDANVADDTITKTSTANDSICGATYYSVNIISIDQTPNPPTDTEITINATSDFSPLLYSIDGSIYQSSNSFTVSTTGTYTAFVKDNANYISQEDFTVEDITGTQYGVRFRHEHKDNDGDTIRYDIEEKDYSGAITTIDMEGGGILTYNKEGDDLYAPIKSSDLELTVYSDTNFQYSDFFTAEDDKFRLRVYKNSNILWLGFFPADSHQETYGDLPYTVDLDFTDYIGKLKEVDFILSKDSNNGNAQGLQSIIYIIAKCLQQTGLFLDINVSIDIFEENQNETSTDTPLAQTYMDLRSFIVEQDRDITKDMNCYDVLYEILKVFGARIYQKDGEWWINNLDQYIKSSLSYVTYDPYGNQTGTDSFTTAKALTGNGASPTVRHVSGDGTIEILPAWDSVTFNQKLVPFQNLLANGSFNVPDSQGGVFANWTDQFGILSERDGAAVLSGDGNDDGWTNYISPDNVFLYSGVGNQIRVSIGYDSLLISDSTGEMMAGTLELKMEVKVGAYYLTSGGQWTLTPMAFEVILNANTDSQFFLWSHEIRAQGVMEIKIYNGRTQTSGVTVSEFVLNYVNIIIINPPELEGSKSLLMVNENNHKFKGDEIDMLFGDVSPYTSNQLLYKNGLYSSTTGNVLTEHWHRSGEDEKENLLQLILLRQLNQRGTPRQLVTLDVHTIGTTIEFDNAITDPNNAGKTFIINSMSLDIQEKIYKLELIELASSEDVDVYRLFEDGTKERHTERLPLSQLRLLE